jgi:TonB family protein
MKALILASALLVTSIPALAGNNPAAQQVLTTSKQQASLFRDQVSPFQLEVDFRAQINVPAQGHLTLKWQAKDRWWRRIVMGDFEQIEIRNGDTLYTKRNFNFTPLRVRELINLIYFAEGSEGLIAKKQRQRIANGTALTCLQVEQENVKSAQHEVCVNSASHDILSDTWREEPDERRTEEYTDYFDFGEHRYPRTLELLANGSHAVTANVQNLTTAAFDETLLVPPKGAIERRQCAGMKHAVPVKTPDPMYPRSASQNKIMGDTTVAMTILTDGSVSDVQLIGSAVRSMDEATLKTLKSWKFKPAMCGADPVVSDIQVVVSFRLY